jgi:hypothetical protein
LHLGDLVDERSVEQLIKVLDWAVSEVKRHPPMPAKTG